MITNFIYFFIYCTSQSCMYNIQNMQKIQKIENKVRKANIKLPIQVTHKKTKITLRLAEQWKAPRT